MSLLTRLVILTSLSASTLSIVDAVKVTTHDSQFPEILPSESIQLTTLSGRTIATVSSSTSPLEAAKIVVDHLDDNHTNQNQIDNQQYQGVCFTSNTHCNGSGKAITVDQKKHRTLGDVFDHDENMNGEQQSIKSDRKSKSLKQKMQNNQSSQDHDGQDADGITDKLKRLSLAGSEPEGPKSSSTSSSSTDVKRQAFLSQSSDPSSTQNDIDVNDNRNDPKILFCTLLDASTAIAQKALELLSSRKANNADWMADFGLSVDTKYNRAQFILMEEFNLILKQDSDHEGSDQYDIESSDETERIRQSVYNECQQMYDHYYNKFRQQGFKLDSNSDTSSCHSHLSDFDLDSEYESVNDIDSNCDESDNNDQTLTEQSIDGWRKAVVRKKKIMHKKFSPKKYVERKLNQQVNSNSRSESESISVNLKPYLSKQSRITNKLKLNSSNNNINNHRLSDTKSSEDSDSDPQIESNKNKSSPSWSPIKVITKLSDIQVPILRAFKKLCLYRQENTLHGDLVKQTTRKKIQTLLDLMKKFEVEQFPQQEQDSQTSESESMKGKKDLSKLKSPQRGSIWNSLYSQLFPTTSDLLELESETRSKLNQSNNLYFLYTQLNSTYSIVSQIMSKLESDIDAERDTLFNEIEKHNTRILEEYYNEQNMSDSKFQVYLNLSASESSDTNSSELNLQTDDTQAESKNNDHSNDSGLPKSVNDDKYLMNAYHLNNNRCHQHFQKAGKLLTANIYQPLQELKLRAQIRLAILYLESALVDISESETIQRKAAKWLFATLLMQAILVVIRWGICLHKLIQHIFNILILREELQDVFGYQYSEASSILTEGLNLFEQQCSSTNYTLNSTVTRYQYGKSKNLCQTELKIIDRLLSFVPNLCDSIYSNLLPFIQFDSEATSSNHNANDNIDNNLKDSDSVTSSLKSLMQLLLIPSPILLLCSAFMMIQWDKLLHDRKRNELSWQASIRDRRKVNRSAIRQQDEVNQLIKDLNKSQTLTTDINNSDENSNTKIHKFKLIEEPGPSSFEYLKHLYPIEERDELREFLGYVEKLESNVQNLVDKMNT